MFNFIKKELKEATRRVIDSRDSDELLYEFVLNEFERGDIAKGLWGKALANSDGDSTKVESTYLKYRVQAIKDVLTKLELDYKGLSKQKFYQLINEKLTVHGTENTDFELNNKLSKEDENIYNTVADELSNGIKKEGLWLKAVEVSGGDEDKALSIYIKYRSQAIKDERAESARILKEKEEKEREKAIQEFLDREQELEDFIKNNRLVIIERISDSEIKVNYENTPIDATIKHTLNGWKIIDEEAIRERINLDDKMKQLETNGVKRDQRVFLTTVTILSVIILLLMFNLLNP